MSDAISQPEIRPAYNAIYGEWGWELLTDYCYKDVLIPACFWWNGANIPASFWQLIYPASDQRLVAPSLVHDWLYSIKQTTREQADKLLVSALDDVGAPKFKRVLVEKAVRIFGAGSWKGDAIDKQYLQSLRVELTAKGIDPGKYLMPGSL